MVFIVVMIYFFRRIGTTLLRPWLGILTLLTAVVCSIIASNAQHTPISGTINRYARVTTIHPCDSIVAVNSSAGFSIGDRVIMVQMKGAEYYTGMDERFGEIENIKGAGSFEILTVRNVAGNEIEFTTRLTMEYDPAGIVQIVRIARYVNARTDGIITPQRWNGQTGGIIALEVDGELLLNSDISATGFGFAGGHHSSGTTNPNVMDYANLYALGRSGGKGEGMIDLPLSMQAGRGRAGNGGGGGNGHNSGGAGGAGAGDGGIGGDATFRYAVRNVGGIGGQGTAQWIMEQKFFPGGGGGGAHQNDGKGTDGGFGGGIIYLKATVIRGNGRIAASGRSVRDTSGMDGAGGGGGGGTIILDAFNVIGNVVVEASGGNGGNVRDLFNMHGPGGGGGGGCVVMIRNLPTITVNVAAGINGSNAIFESSEIKDNPAWGATSGKDGTVVNRFQWKQPVSITLETSRDTVICPDTYATLSASPGFIRYEWSTGETTRTIQTSQAGLYVVTATDPGGCRHVSTPMYVLVDSMEIDFPEIISFGLVDLGRAIRRTITISNRDSNPITIAAVTVPPGFRIVSPITLPMVISPKSNVAIDVEFRPLESRVHDYHMQFDISSPCAEQRRVRLTGEVTAVYVLFSLPDTVGSIGDNKFTIGLKASIQPTTVQLPDSDLTMMLTWDGSFYAVHKVTGATVLRDVISLVTHEREMTIRFSPINLKGGDTLLAALTGTIMVAPTLHTYIRIASYSWKNVMQEPFTSVRNGSIQAAPVCFQQGRMIEFHGRSRMKVAPNPAYDDVAIRFSQGLPGDYTLSLVDVRGQVVHEQVYGFPGSQEPSDVEVVIRDLSPGAYQVRLQTPATVVTETVIVSR